MRIITNGISYFVRIYQKEKNLPNLIFLHGFMGSGKGFEHLMKPLNSFCNPITIDLLGHAKTDGADAPARFAAGQQTADLKDIIHKISEAPPMLYGYSMGGRLALQFTLKNPNTIGGLILESTNYGIEGDLKLHKRKQLDEKRAKAIENDFPSFLNGWERLPLFQSGTSTTVEKISHYQTIQREQDPIQMAYSLRGFGTAAMPSVKEKLKGLKLPMLLLAGQADLKYVKIAQHMHRQLPAGKLSIIPKAGHRIHVQQPEALTIEIKSFINQH